MPDSAARGSAGRPFAVMLLAWSRACQAQPTVSRMISAYTLSAAMPSGQRQLPTSP